MDSSRSSLSAAEQNTIMPLSQRPHAKKHNHKRHHQHMYQNEDENHDENGNDILSSSSSSLTKQQAPKKKARTTLPIQEPTVFQYVNFRILDSIGFPGAYRKFMLKRKDQGAEWAIHMNEHVAQVQGAIKELSLLEQVVIK